MSASTRSTSRWWAWLAVWLLLTAAASALHAALWLSGDPTTGLAASAFWRLTGDVVYALNLPAWIAVLFAHPPARFGGVEFAIIAYGLGWLVWLSVILGARWLRRTSGRGRATKPVSNPARRRLLIDAGLGAGAAVTLGPVAYGTLVEPWSLRITRHTLTIRDLPPGLRGLRVALFADPHVGPRVPDEFIRRAVQATLDLKPDLILLLGDYIHIAAPAARRSAELIAPLVSAGIPHAAVRGNHDWRGGRDFVSDALRAVGVRFIDNDRLFLDESRRLLDQPPPGDAPTLCLAGLGDLHEHVVDVAAALRDVPQTTPRLVLAHQPATAWHPDLARAGTPDGPRIDAMVCGHTHGGQVNLPVLGSPAKWLGWLNGYTSGVDRRRPFPVVVSSGIGLSLIPVRLNAPPEIVELTLQ